MIINNEADFKDRNGGVQKEGKMRDPEEVPISAPISDPAPAWPLSLLAHYLVAVVGAVIIGFLPEAFVSKIYYNTGIEAYSPMIALTAFLLGYFVAGFIFDGRTAMFVWIIGLGWLVFGIFDTTQYWNASWSPEKTRWAIC